MFELSVEVGFSAAHCIRGHTGRCASLHGHNYRVVVSVTSQHLNEQAMVMDFADLKAVCREVVDALDHTVLNELSPFVEVNPTAEAVARHLYGEISERLNHLRQAQVGAAAPVLDRVAVYESESSYATYRG